ncbi:uncharacterized protein RCC_09675 [Ramularia collo-cygni]|uniref:Uncharacterized protein n=1 Tax=Ramularia collo-cygni TaxID=112498 RepID=A0A2D3VKK1_9PEZI|nr:uncharacterized protein RCC_09675 [Ramularia collo-cygni]CZT23959.1 uncharacterized protein RCC_09675 [Ramularia collo-cygni]
MAHSMDIPETNAFSPAPNGKMPPAVELEYLSRIVFLVVPASQTPPWLEDHIADCFKSDVDNFPASATWEQMVDMFRKVNKADPHYDPQILNVLVDLNEHGKSFKGRRHPQQVRMPKCLY